MLHRWHCPISLLIHSQNVGIIRDSGAERDGMSVVYSTASTPLCGDREKDHYNVLRGREIKSLSLSGGKKPQSVLLNPEIDLRI